MLMLVGVWIGAIALVFVRWRKLRDLQQQPIVSFKKPLHMDKVRVVKSADQAIIYLKPTVGSLDKQRLKSKTCKSASDTPGVQSPVRSPCDRSVFSFDEHILRHPPPDGSPASAPSCRNSHLQPLQLTPAASSSRSSPNPASFVPHDSTPSPHAVYSGASEATSGLGPSLLSSSGYQLPLYRQQDAREPTITLTPVLSPGEEPTIERIDCDVKGNCNGNANCTPAPFVVLVQMHSPKEDAFHETPLVPKAAGSSAQSSDSANTTNSSREQCSNSSREQGAGQPHEQQQQQEPEPAVLLDRTDRVHYWQTSHLRHIDSSFISHTSQEK